MANGRVCTGFSKPYVAVYSATGGTITYANGQALARGVDVSIEPETSEDNIFHADNVQAESASGSFTGGTVTLTVDGLKTAAEKLIMGLPEPDTDGFMHYGNSQNIPYVGIGFIARYMEDGVTSYVPYILVKCVFSQIGTEAATQEDEIDWQTQELTATIMRGDDTDQNWKSVGKEYATEAAAYAAMTGALGA